MPTLMVTLVPNLSPPWTWLYPIVGLAASYGRTIKAHEIIGSALDPGAQVSKNVLTVKSLLSPLANEQVKVVRCLGLNYSDHAVSLYTLFTKCLQHLKLHSQAEVKMAAPAYVHACLFCINRSPPITQIPCSILQTRHISYRTPSHRCHPQSSSTT